MTEILLMEGSRSNECLKICTVLNLPVVHEFIEFFFKFRCSLCTLAGVVLDVLLHPWFLPELDDTMYIAYLK